MVVWPDACASPRLRATGKYERRGGPARVKDRAAEREQLARQIIAWGRPIPLDEIVAKVEAVTLESTRAAGRALLARGRPALAALGPGPGLEHAAMIADSLAREPA